MITILAERPLTFSIMIGLFAAGLLYGWLQSGDKKLAIGGALFALLIPVVWIVADSWQTDRELISDVIDTTARAVAANDHDLAVQCIANDNTRAQARAELPRYVFDRVTVNNRTIRVMEDTIPKAAEVELMASVIASDKSGRLQNMRVLRRIILSFEKINGTWKVVDYNHMQPGGQPDSFSPPNIVGQRSTVRN